MVASEARFGSCSSISAAFINFSSAQLQCPKDTVAASTFLVTSHCHLVRKNSKPSILGEGIHSYLHCCLKLMQALHALFSVPFNTGDSQLKQQEQTDETYPVGEVFEGALWRSLFDVLNIQPFLNGSRRCHQIGTILSNSSLAGVQT